MYEKEKRLHDGSLFLSYTLAWTEHCVIEG